MSNFIMPSYCTGNRLRCLSLWGVSALSSCLGQLSAVCHHPVPFAVLDISLGAASQRALNCHWRMLCIICIPVYQKRTLGPCNTVW